MNWLLRALRRPHDRSSAVVVEGLVFALVLAGLGVLVNMSMNGRFSNNTDITAVMSDIGGGLAPGNDVKMRGVVVGHVVSVGGDPHRVVLDLEILSSALPEIPANVQARVLPATVFGTSYVDLTVPAGNRSTSVLGAGATIIQDTSAPTIELQQALNDLDKLVGSLHPAQLSIVLQSISGSLDGRGKGLGVTVSKLNHLLGVLNPKIGLVKVDLNLLLTNLQVLQKATPDLLNSLVDTADIAHNITTHRVAYAQLFAAAVKLVDDGNGFLDATEQAYVRAIIASAHVSQAVYDNRTGISRQTIALDELLKKVLTVTNGGPIHIDIRLVNAALYPYYTSADCPRYENDPGTNCGRS